MSAKVLIWSGAVTTVLSVTGIAFGIIESFRAAKTNEGAGIGAVGLALELAVVCNILALVGVAVLIAGLIKFFKDKTKSK